jgi:hypothetical protein
MRKRWAFDERFFFDFRYTRDEDFDGRYDRTLTGIGVNFEDGWSATLLGDVVGAKENIDAHIELAWRDAAGSRFRTALVLPDATFDRKSNTGEYTERPYTFFVEAFRVTADHGEGGFWINWNPRLELRPAEEPSFFTYEQLQGGARWSRPIGDAWRLTSEAVGESGSRSRVTAAAGATETRELDRDHFRIRFEAERRLSDSLEAWFGFRHFRLRETEGHSTDPVQRGETTRRENMVFCGVDWQARRRLVFWPGVHLNFADIEKDYPLDPERDERTDKLFVKLAFPLEFSFANGALLTINQTMRLDTRSGGSNVQVYVPF